MEESGEGQDNLSESRFQLCTEGPGQKISPKSTDPVHLYSLQSIARPIFFKIESVLKIFHGNFFLFRDLKKKNSKQKKIESVLRKKLAKSYV